MFKIQQVDKSARTGILRTAHGDIRTPAFMPVGTVGTVKGMLPESVKETGADIILGNTYHLMLRPTAERVARFGGLHKFMNWNGPILTDSGGFQVMSLSKLRKINERAVTFQSHLDGTAYELTPERAIEIQHLLGSDISMVLDECTPYPATEEQAAESMRLSMRWAERKVKMRFNRADTVTRLFSASCKAASIRNCARNRRRLETNRVRRLCHWRSGGGRGAEADVRRARCHHAAHAGR
jgi:tRNA-guanine transglycosylase